jgi:hypothetical protein
MKRKDEREDEREEMGEEEEGDTFITKTQRGLMLFYASSIFLNWESPTTNTICKEPM